MAVQAFIYDLGLNKVSSTSSGSKDADIVQQNAGWVVAFFPFAIRDSKNLLPASEAQRTTMTRDPFVVINDCTRLQVTHGKDSPFGSMEAVLRSGDINYLSAIAPGDIVMAWMHSDIDKLDTVIRNVEASKEANGFDSGLKFIGRVEAVREHLTVNPLNGVKQVSYIISAFSFQEFNTKVYQNFFDISPVVLFNNLRTDWQNVIGELKTEKYKNHDNVQILVRAFLNVTMGAGPGNTIIEPIKATPNDVFLVPGVVGRVLGRNTKEKPQLKYTDILTLVQGIQEYSKPNTTNSTIGFIPANLTSKSTDKRQYATNKACTGSNISFPDKWSDVPIWSILMQYTNSIINELYTTLRVDVDGKIVPTLIMRQIPFSTETFKKANPQENVTLFLSLPRWKPHPAQVISHNIGRSNALRVNYVQIWGSMNVGDSGEANTYAWQASKVPQFDAPDIKRSGLRTYIASSSLDFPVQNNFSNAESWAKKIADWAINGHLKLNGSVQMVGVSEPICVGDNFEWDGIVYHIERITHTCEIAPNGMKNFRTIADLSNGLRVNEGLPKMDNEFRENLAAADKEKILPGYSDVQLIGGRDKGEVTTNANRSNADLRGANSLKGKK